MFIKKQLIRLTSCLTLMICIAGCGSVVRASGSVANQGTYQGVSSDFGIIGDVWSWYSSLGITPLIAIASLPVDVVVDTILYPMDFAAKDMQYINYLEDLAEMEFQQQTAPQKRISRCQSVCLCNTLRNNSD